MTETTASPQRAMNGSAVMPDFRTWMDGQSRVIESWAHFNSGMMRSSNDFSQDIVTFLQRRFQAETDAWKVLTSCRNPSEMFECQRDFVATSTNQYLEDAKNLTTKIIEIVSGATSCLRPDQFLFPGNGRGTE